jgi:hypothetical protein
MTSPTIVTSATTQISISTTLPATYTATDFASLTWVPIAAVTSLGTFGGKTSVQKFVVLDTGTVIKRAGSVDYGTINAVLSKHTGADMTALQTAFTSRASTAFKITYPTALGGSAFFTGIVTGIQTNVGNADAIMQTNLDIELDNAVIEGT